MNVFGRFFYSARLQSENLTETAQAISQHGYRCQDWPSGTVTLSDYTTKYPEKNVFTIPLNAHDVTLKIDNARGFMIFSSDFSTSSKENEALFLQDLLPFFDWLFMYYDFEFGYIDKEGDTHAKMYTFIDSADIETLFFMNYWGIKFIKKHQLDFWKQAPGHATQLPNNTIRYRSRSKINGASSDEVEKLKSYFKDSARLSLYKASKRDDW